MEAKEVADITYQVTTCCCDPVKDTTDEVCSARCGKVVQALLIVVSLGIGIFDSYTDWSVWIGISQHGFGLLQLPDVFLYTWLAFTIIGSLLIVVSFITDVIDLVSNRSTCSSDHGRTLGFNSLTCSEVFSFIILLLEDMPILTLTCTYVMFQEFICVGFDPSSAAGSVGQYRDLFISAVVSTAAIVYRLGRSFYRICYSYGHCRCCCQAPPKNQRLCPKGSCIRKCCIVPYSIGLCGLLFFSVLAVAAVALAGSVLSFIPGDPVFGGTASSLSLRPSVDWNITHSPPVASNSSTLGDVERLIENGHLRVTEAFHRNLDETTYCLAYFEFHPKEIVFNIANIDRQRSINALCLCNPDSTPCDRYYENIFIGVFNETLDARSAAAIGIGRIPCPLPPKLLRRNRDLHVNCNCNFSDIVEHWVL